MCRRLTLETFSGSTLLAILNSKMMAKSNLTEQEVLDILVDVVAGVSRLHQCSTPVIHRDLKIENVLEEDGKYILCDFGSGNLFPYSTHAHQRKVVNFPSWSLLPNVNLRCFFFYTATAKVWDPAVHGTLPTQEDLEKYTTLAYRSPEMVDLYSNRGAISCKSDIWALGVFLFKVNEMSSLGYRGN